MELQERTTKVRGMIETVIRRTVDPKWKYTQSGMAALQLQSGLELLPKLRLLTRELLTLSCIRYTETANTSKMEGGTRPGYSPIMLWRNIRFSLWTKRENRV